MPRDFRIRLCFAGAVALTGLAPGSGASQSATTSFARAETAVMTTDFIRAERAYREALADDTIAEHRATATRMLANFAWRIHRDTALASRTLTSGEGIPRALHDLLLERTRMLLDAGDFGGARDAAIRATHADSHADERINATAALTATLIGARKAALLDGITTKPMPTESGSSALQAAVAQLTAAVRENPGRLGPARVLVEAAAIVGDGPAMLTGWQSYYLIGTGDTATGPLLNPRRTLGALLPGWRGVEVRAGDREQLVRALADSRFFDAAALVALGETAPTKRAASAPTSELVEYARFLHRVERVTNEYYRQVAIGRADTSTWKDQLIASAIALWPHLNWAGAAPPFTFEKLAPELDRRFGALVNIGVTAGQLDLHMGHRVVDERRHVSQYGRSADVRFVALDAMASNGYQSWAWDGRAAHGGWGNRELIVQVRTGYSEEPLRTWGALADSSRALARTRATAADSASDVLRARTTPVAYFPSIRERLMRDGQQRLIDSLRAAGLGGAKLEAQFERLYGDALIESSIFAHEGRHAIDGAIGASSNSTDLEFRAKLSEVAFAPRPRLAFGAILTANIGDGSPHGNANERIARGLLGWLEAHRRDVRGLDETAPLLVQFPLLSDDQLRAAMASMDPLADGRPPRAPLD